MPDTTQPYLPFSTLMTHALPVWFLMLSLFLPRIALVAAWFQGLLVPFHLDGYFSPIFTILIPRLLVLFLIFRDRGIDGWFEAHAVVALFLMLGLVQHQTKPAVDRFVIRRRRPAVQTWR